MRIGNRPLVMVNKVLNRLKYTRNLCALPLRSLQTLGSFYTALLIGQLSRLFMRTVLLSAAALFGIALWAMAVYSDGAMAGNVPVDGYGVSSVSVAKTF
jgi:hypothetical protein